MMIRNPDVYSKFIDLIYELISVFLFLCEVALPNLLLIILKFEMKRATGVRLAYRFPEEEWGSVRTQKVPPKFEQELPDFEKSHYLLFVFRNLPED
jgi:hypothetical protein